MQLKFLNFNKVLCLSPHPDDVEYSIVGSILQSDQTQFDILCLTQGGDFDQTNSEDRLQEVNNFWSGVKNVNLFFTDTDHLKSKQEDEWVNFIENKFDINSYDAIMTTNQIDSHFEHRQTSRIAHAICRASKVGIIEYKSPSTLVDWVPNYFIDISKSYSKKIEMLNSFVSQGKRVYFQQEQIKAFHINFQSSKRGLEIVEMFKIIQLYD